VSDNERRQAAGDDRLKNIHFEIRNKDASGANVQSDWTYRDN